MYSTRQDVKTMPLLYHDCGA